MNVDCPAILRRPALVAAAGTRASPRRSGTRTRAAPMRPDDGGVNGGGVVRLVTIRPGEGGHVHGNNNADYPRSPPR